MVRFIANAFIASCCSASLIALFMLRQWLSHYGPDWMFSEVLDQRMIGAPIELAFASGACLVLVLTFFALSEANPIERNNND